MTSDHSLALPDSPIRQLTRRLGELSGDIEERLRKGRPVERAMYDEERRLWRDKLRVGTHDDK
jgi:hypothetical protein